jgi:molecular chaperone DnaK
MAKDNKSLGKFILDGLPPAPRGVPQISVSLDINANGIIEVLAVDKATQKKQNIRIEGSSNLSKDEIERMKREAQENEEKDKKEKDDIDKLNKADASIFQSEKNIKDFGEKLTESDRTTLKETLDKLRQAHSIKDIPTVDSLTNELNEKWNSISTKMYQQSQGGETTQQQNTSGETQKGPKQPPEDVQDVEFTEVK